MVKSATDDETGTAPGVRPTRKPLPTKVIVMGSIPIADNDFLAWQSVHCPRLGTRDAMLMYVRYLNGEDKIRFEQEMEQWKTYMRSRLPPHQREHLEGLMANKDLLSASVTELKAVNEILRHQIILATEDIAEHKALNETLSQTIILTPQNTPQNILSLQVVPNSQNIPPPLEQSSPQIRPAPLPLEQSPSLNITQPVSEQMTGPPGTHRSPSPETLNANNLTMQQALDLFELLQARKSKEAEKSVTVEAEPVARAPARAEPLSYLTLGTGEGIIASTNPDVLQEQTSSWEEKVGKHMRLSHTYSSSNTISGEKCYMVDEALYKDILLAVAARKQNENTLSSASEKLEQHLVQIEDSHKRII
jgi:hypothetical protein